MSTPYLKTKAPTMAFLTLETVSAQGSLKHQAGVRGHSTRAQGRVNRRPVYGEAGPQTTLTLSMHTHTHTCYQHLHRGFGSNCKGLVTNGTPTQLKETLNRNITQPVTMRQRWAGGTQA